MSPHLSLDIHVEIIKLFPVKSLIQCRSVCKAWKSLIDSSQFINGYNTGHDHLMIRYGVESWEENKVKYISFVDDDSFPQQKFALTAPSPVKRETIVDSSHGLLCLIGYIGERNDSSRTQLAVLWNPAIKKSIDVVVPHVVDLRFNHVFGFGVCPHTKDPTLVKIITCIDDAMKSCIPCRQVLVFTLSSGEWTCLCRSNLPRKSIEFRHSKTTVIDEFIYWNAYDMIDEGGRFRYHNLIMSFDMSTQEFREVDLPDSLAMAESVLSISRIRKSLVVVEYSRVVKNVCHVWMMGHGDSKAFTKLFTINVPIVWTMGFRKSGEPLVKRLNDDKDFSARCELVLYEPCSEHIKDLGIQGYGFLVKTYTESLLLLDHKDGHIVRCEAVKR